MGNPVIYIEDPTRNDYTALIEQVLALNVAIGRVDIFIGTKFNDSVQLNEILLKYYNLTRNTATENGSDYKFEINILFNQPFAIKSNWNIIFKLKLENLSINTKIKVIDIDAEITSESFESGGKTPNSFSTVAVGGTFDHLHDGHKILLSISLFLANTILIVGITGTDLLVNKKFAEVLESYYTRQLYILKFLSLILFNHTSTFHLYEINDVCGPTGYVRNIDALVVSRETIKGSDFVNQYRKDRDFHPLDVQIINVIGNLNDSDETNNWQGKLSSTDIREQLASRKI